MKRPSLRLFRIDQIVRTKRIVRKFSLYPVPLADKRIGSRATAAAAKSALRRPYRSFVAHHPTKTIPRGHDELAVRKQAVRHHCVAAGVREYATRYEAGQAEHDPKRHRAEEHIPHRQVTAKDLRGPNHTRRILDGH